MCKGSPSTPYSLKEVAAHNKKDDTWVVIDGLVYNITEWQHRHPGGRRVITHYAAEDATEPFHAFHPEMDNVKKYLKPLQVGVVSEYKPLDIQQDFRDLRVSFEEQGLFTPNYWFYAAHFASILAIEVVAYFVLSRFATGAGALAWTAYVAGSLLLMTSQAQLGWLQHDFGHLSVFNNSFLAHAAHRFIIGFMKAASSDWWNHRHFQHHAKPNVASKDPDIALPYVFLLGDKIPVQWGLKKKAGILPYNFQHLYFHILGPLLLLPTYFHYENLYYVFKRGRWADLATMVLFFMKHFAVYGPVFGFWPAFGLYMFFRTLESHWFTWVTQMSHIPMEIDWDQKKDWVNLQLAATCNVEPGMFNDWFTGHLNFQIEHHLFPTMPRHNYIKVQPLVKSLCAKHGVAFHEKTLLGAFSDVLSSLEHSGQLWYDAYYHN